MKKFGLTIGVILAFLFAACPTEPGGRFAPTVADIEEGPAPEGPALLGFSVAADMRSFVGATEFRGALDSLLSVGAGAFLASPGDIDPPDAVQAAIEEKLGAGFPWFPVVGNHEADTESDMAFLRAYDADTACPGVSNFQYGPPGALRSCYSFDAGPAHFAMINEYYDGASDVGASPSPTEALAGTISPALLEWLEADLEAAGARKPRFIFVFGHEPLSSLPDEESGRQRHSGECLDGHPEEVRAFIDLLLGHRVTAYLCGHTHDYSAAVVDGVVQIDVGHARGSADTGAPSSFLKVELYSNVAVFSPYRDFDLNGTGYEKGRAHRLR